MICNTEKKLKKQFRIDKSQPSSIDWARFLTLKHGIEALLIESVS